MPFALGNQWLGVVGMANEDDDRDEVSSAIAVPVEIGKQPFVIARIRFRLASVAGGMDAGRPAERGDAES